MYSNKNKYNIHHKKIESNIPATQWCQSLLIGNGALGGAVYGGYTHETIALSEITFFSGEKDTNYQEGAPEAFVKMRRAVIAGDYSKAVEESNSFIGVRKNYGTNLPVGQLNIEFHDLKSKKCKDYNQILDIETGIVSIYGIYEGENSSDESLILSREAFAAHEDKILYYRINSNKVCSYTIDFTNEYIIYKTFSENNQYFFDLQALENIHSDGKTGVKLVGSINIHDSDGLIQITDHGVRIIDATYTTVQLKMITDYDDNEPDFKGHIDKHKLFMTTKSSEYEKIKKSHVEDIKIFMKRIDLNLDGNDDLSEMMMQYGRYLLLSSSRVDSKLPTHLQGIWNDNVACRIGWTCDMHLDINTQMNYWLSEAGNLSESHEPLFNWMDKAVIPSGRITAKMNYGMKGWSADLVSNSWGYSAPYWSSTISPCPTSGIWMASDYWEHFLYTQDKTFLIERAYPVLREAVEFFVDYVFKEGDFYTSGPSISPENSFLVHNETYYFSNGCTYEIVMIRELFEQYEKLMSILNKKDILLTHTKEILAKLMNYRILEDKTIAEYAKDYELCDPWHRHTSHLLGVFPYHQIMPDKTPELAKAAYETVKAKITPNDKWEDTGWARSMLMLYMARLGKGDEALWHIQQMQEILTQPNLLVMHPPTRGAGSFKEVYELDGNTGCSMCMIEMLIQSHDNRIQILPALPSKWSSGHIKGVKARGNIEVDIRWDNGELTQLQVISPIGQDVIFQYKDITKIVCLEANIKQIIHLKQT